MLHRSTRWRAVFWVMLAPLCMASPLPQINLEGLEASVRDQFNTALASFTKNLETANDPNEKASQYAELGRLFHAYEFLDEARWCYEQALYANPRDFGSYYLAAVAGEGLGQHELAEARFQSALLLRPDYLPAVVRLSTLLRDKGRLPAARMVLERTPDHLRGTAAWLAEAGEQALAENDYEDAIELLSQALRAQPAANRLHYPIATAYRELGNSDLARDSLARSGAIGVTPEDPLMARVQSLSAGELSRLIEGRRAFGAGDFAAAVDLFGQALEANPASVAGRVNLGSALIQLGYFDSAEQQFLAALKLDPVNVAALHNLGALSELKDNVQESLNWYARVLEINPREPEVHYRMGLLHRRSGARDQAITFLSKAQRDKRFYVDASFELAGIATDSGEYRLAIDLLQGATQAAPHSRKLTLGLAKLLAASPDADLRSGTRALTLAQPVHQSAPDAASAEIVALAQAELGRCSEAKDTVVAALELKGLSAAEQERLRAAAMAYKNDADCRP